MPQLSIETAQNVRINYQPAGVLPRIAAYIIDSAFLYGCLLLLFLLSGILTSTNNFDTLIEQIYLIFIGLLFTLYHLLCELFFNGRSLGKTVLKLRVVRTDGGKLTFWNCLLRWTLRLFDITLFMGIPAIIAIITTAKAQRVGDLAAGTTVIRETPGATLDQLAPDAPEEDYRPRFPQAALLTDRDMVIIKEILREAGKEPQHPLLLSLAQRIQNIIGVQSDLSPLDFIHTIQKDYNALTQ